MHASRVFYTTLSAALLLAIAMPTLVGARGFAGGGMRGGGFDRGGADRGGDFNRNLNVDHSANVNVNRNVDVNNSYHSGWYGDYHPVATGVAVGAGVALGAAAIGSIAYSLPGNCSLMPYGGISYQQCGGVWYQPQYAGTQVQYIVVNPPQ
jgi:hypothetical protein